MHSVYVGLWLERQQKHLTIIQMQQGDGMWGSPDIETSGVLSGNDNIINVQCWLFHIHSDMPHILYVQTSLVNWCEDDRGGFLQLDSEDVRGGFLVSWFKYLTIDTRPD